ncbi:integrative conjugative element protein, RAQPRD family [Burkholderia cepacia]|uniref:integrative conjugative element protein, RAQPRD family n=1 Tax=Burkholderia cepacia TaxID=292 RepID=UPI002AB64018|nr:RAQPRD family integrative conjugative element protein [Burkholderia cepacia]
MEQTRRPAFACPRTHMVALLPFALAMLFAAASTAHAEEDAPEREQLAAVIRQLDLADRVARHATHTPSEERARYHFDYARLREDLKRIRAGVQDYLVPQRAQPRDPFPMIGDYVSDDNHNATEKAKP